MYGLIADSSLVWFPLIGDARTAAYSGPGAYRIIDESYREVEAGVVREDESTVPVAAQQAATTSPPVPASNQAYAPTVATLDALHDASMDMMCDWLIESSHRAAGSLYGMGPRLARSTGAEWGI